MFFIKKSGSLFKLQNKLKKNDPHQRIKNLKKKKKKDVNGRQKDPFCPRQRAMCPQVREEETLGNLLELAN